VSREIKITEPDIETVGWVGACLFGSMGFSDLHLFGPNFLKLSCMLSLKSNWEDFILSEANVSTKPILKFQGFLLSCDTLISLCKVLNGRMIYGS
jgi:hypothetical protein